MQQANLAASARGEADQAQRYERIRRHSEVLAAPLSDEDCALQSMADASPVKWHLAHVSWFFETLILLPHSPGYREFHPRFAYLFNSYYETLGPRHARPQRGLLSRPSRGEIMAYRAHVDTAMMALLGQGTQPALADLIELGLQHEQQHQELILMDIKHALSLNPLEPVYAQSPAKRASLQAGAGSAPPGWCAFDAGLYEIGAEPDQGFCFDNEGARHQRYVEAFVIADRPVSSGEFLEFIGEGGYQQPALWLSDGWACRQAQDWQAPLYWFQRDGQWWRYSLYGARPLSLDEPVCHLSYYEADAYARWAGARLPDEAQWELFARSRWADLAAPEAGLEPTAPQAGAGGLGQVWEWTASAYAPYPGYRPAAGALAEYNGKFMCNQMVLRGGCAATPPGHARPSYRNFYYPQQRWMFAGLRLARDV